VPASALKMANYRGVDMDQFLRTGASLTFCCDLFRVNVWKQLNKQFIIHVSCIPWPFAQTETSLFPTSILRPTPLPCSCQRVLVLQPPSPAVRFNHQVVQTELGHALIFVGEQKLRQLGHKGSFDIEYWTFSHWCTTCRSESCGLRVMDKT
jgi:hypothetical protein